MTTLLTILPLNGTKFRLYMHDAENDTIVVNNGWELMSYENLTTYWDDFVDEYSSTPGLQTIGDISGIGHCCLKFKNHDSSFRQAMEIYCTWVGIVSTLSPTSWSCDASSSNGTYYLIPFSYDAITDMSDIAIEHDQSICQTSTNYGIYYKDYPPVSTVKFAIYMHNSENDSIVTDGGWMFMSYKNLTDYWDEFKDAYNSNPGLNTIGDISGIINCCVKFKDSDSATAEAMLIYDIWVGIVDTASPTSWSCLSSYSDGSYYLKPYSYDAISNMSDSINIVNDDSACATSTNIGL